MAKKDWMVLESQLDDDQLNVLNAINDKSCIVSGCAGSGKSVLALIKAQRIQNEKGDDYKIIVFTKALCKYMNSGREVLGIKNEFQFHFEWKYQKEVNSNRYLRAGNGNNIPKKPLPSADYVIVDEIQDFTKEEIQEFLSATKKHFFFFGDTAQSIYNGMVDSKIKIVKITMPVNKISTLLPPEKEYKYFELYRNYRLPIPVAKLVQHIGVGLDGFVPTTYKSKETAIPRFIQCTGLFEQVEVIIRIIEVNSFTDVGIFLPNNKMVKQVSDLLNQRNFNHESKYNDKENWRNNVDNLDFSTTNPKVMTYHSAKGLQFEAVFLPNVTDQQGNESEQKALYVAMTRTYRNLYAFYSGSMPDTLSNVPPELYEIEIKAQIENI